MNFFSKKKESPAVQQAKNPSTKTPKLTYKNPTLKLEKNLLHSENLPVLRQLTNELLISPETNVKEDNISDLQAWKDEEILWLSDQCLLRYLRAENGNTEKALNRLDATLKWRRSFKPHKIDPKEMVEECMTGKVYLNGFDKVGRPIMYMVCRKAGSGNYENGLKWSIFLMEKATSLMAEGVEQVAIVIDYEGMSMASRTPMSITKQWISILANHYPERLGASFMINPGWTLWLFFRLISTFLDPVTKKKIHFADTLQAKKLISSDEEVKIENQNEGFGQWINLGSYIDDSELQTEYSGAFAFEFDHEVYWKELMKIE